MSSPQVHKGLPTHLEENLLRGDIQSVPMETPITMHFSIRTVCAIATHGYSWGNDPYDVFLAALHKLVMSNTRGNGVTIVPNVVNPDLP